MPTDTVAEAWANDRGWRREAPITEAERILLRWQTGGAGGWEAAFFKLCSVSDNDHLATLATAFPALTAAYLQWTRGDLAQRAAAAGVL